MCTIKDATRHEEAGDRVLTPESARISFLEAASIFVMLAETMRDDSLLVDANRCYQKSRKVMGRPDNILLSKGELARRTLLELNEVDELSVIRKLLEVS
jgi:hypothetical protein